MSPFRLVQKATAWRAACVLIAALVRWPPRRPPGRPTCYRAWRAGTLRGPGR